MHLLILHRVAATRSENGETILMADSYAHGHSWLITCPYAADESCSTRLACFLSVTWPSL